MTNDNNALFAAQPAVAADGTLTYTPAGDANGNATVTLVARDDGGVADGGQDASAPQTFTITIDPVNDAPSFTAGGDQTSLEDTGPQTVAAWATGISPGPTNESGQAVWFEVTNDNNSMFAAQPVVAADGALTYMSVPNANGSAMVTVIARDDGGTANGGQDASAPETFTITIDPVNDAPSFTAGGDQTVVEDAGAQTLAAWATGISPGPADESGQAVWFEATNDNNSMFAAQPAVAADGALTYTPVPNANGSATVTRRWLRTPVRRPLRPGPRIPRRDPRTSQGRLSGSR